MGWRQFKIPRKARATFYGLALLVSAVPATAQVVLNELLAENGLWNQDDEGDYEDWAELYNTGGEEVKLAGYTLTDDPALPRKWILPDVSIPPQGYVLVWLSGKNRYSPAPVVNGADGRNPAFQPVYVKLAEDWRYVIADPAGSGPPVGWNRVDFNDGSWSVGRPGFGYGDGDDTTEVPVDTNAVFTRKKFTMPSPAAVSSLVLRLDYDDAFVVYLNGVRVAADGFGPGDPNFQSVAAIKREAGEPVLYDLTAQKGLLVPGENVLAVVGLNNIPSTDMSLAVELGAMPASLHASFKLEKKGEYLGLSDAAGNIADSVTFGMQTQDHSYGRVPDGSGSWRYLLVPAPSAPNGEPSFDAPLPDGVVFTPDSGKFTAAPTVSMAPNQAGAAEVRFTTDGSVPTEVSSLFTAPLRVDANTVFRAAAFVGGVRATPIVSKSYFLGGAIALPVLSISMDPADYQTVHMSEGAHGRVSERLAFMEFFEAGFSPGTALPFGLRLHGGASRGGDFETKKSYKGYFRGAYGHKRLKYPIIPDTGVDSFDKLVLRAGFNDCFRTNGRAAYIRDQLTRDLHEDMGGVVSHGSWCMLYVNMKFRGLYNIVERLDEDFLESYTGEAAWDVIKTGNDALAGDLTEWNSLRNFMIQSDLSNEAVYRQAEKLVDIENFTSYMILNIWAQNEDWINNNWYAARPRRPDGKWIFMSWDAEFGIGLIPAGTGSNTFEFVFTRDGYLRDIFESLLKSPVYRAYFAEEADRHAYGALYRAPALQRIKSLEDRVKADVPEEVALFGQSSAQWNANMAECRTFVTNRGAPFLNTISRSTRYSFPPMTTPRILTCDPPKVVNTGDAQVTLSGVRLSESTQLFFDGVPAGPLTRVLGTRWKATIPFDLTIEGFPVISARDPATGSASAAERLLEVVVPRPEPSDLTPAKGKSSGGERVRIPGIGFLPGVTVKFGEAVSPEVTLTDGVPMMIEALTPPGRGQVDVRVINRVAGGEIPSRAAFRFSYEGIDEFVRGDSNSDGKLDISDAVRLLEKLFLGKGSVGCEDAADANDSGTLDISDAIFSLASLFQGGSEPPPPYPACGPDPSGDQLACDLPPSCGR